MVNAPFGKCVVGIDPGFKGGIAFLYPHTLFVEDMPTIEVFGRETIDIHEVKRLLLAHPVKHVAIEKVSSMPEQGVASTFCFGFNTGKLYGLIYALNLPLIPVIPSVWKSALNLSSSKRKSLVLAKKLFPANTKDFQKMRDEGKAEAALIAYFANK